MTHSAVPAWRKGHYSQGQVKDKATKNIKRMDVREETSGETRRHQWNKEPRLKTATTSEEREDNGQRHQRTAGGRSQVWEAEQHSTRPSGRTINIGALTTLGTFGCINRRKIIVINLD
jgi:hypothetical protein